jgi:hypothetical protein
MSLRTQIQAVFEDRRLRQDFFTCSYLNTRTHCILQYTFLPISVFNIHFVLSWLLMYVAWLAVVILKLSILNHELGPIV